MSIQLGLSRISRLFDARSIRWKAVHVAGTNGKGSVCAYAAAMLAATGRKVGRFTSPHLIDRWDSIQIDGRTIEHDLFMDVERSVIKKKKDLGIDPSPFEILTATAFEAFNREKVDVGVVEVGVGGREDATNILPANKVLATVITKIGMDHESLLGSDISKVAWHKAGIMKPGVPCLFDDTNAPEVAGVLRKEREALDPKGTTPLTPVGRDMFLDAMPSSAAIEALFKDRQPQNHQLMAMSLALAATDTVLETLQHSEQGRGEPVSRQRLAESVGSVKWPGRLQSISLAALTGREEPVLLDGAHNVDSAKVLAYYVDEHMRTPLANPITWIYASSEGKDVENMAWHLFGPRDVVVTTMFKTPDGMPWVKSEHVSVLLQKLKGFREEGPELHAIRDVRAAIRRACEISAGGPLVIAGSLYLVAGVLRLLREKGVDVGV